MRAARQRRKKFWIDPGLQLQIAAWMVGLVLLSLFLVSFGIIEGLRWADFESGMPFHSIDWVYQSLAAPIAVASALSLSVAAFIAVVWSHHLAGPLRVLSAALERLGRGDLSAEIRLRATDAHKDLLGDFGRAQEGLREILDKDREKIAALKAAVENSPDLSPKDKKKWTDQLDEIGSSFKIADD